MFRFTIRDVLWLTVVAAVLAAWLGNRRQIFERHAAEQRMFLNEAQSLLDEAKATLQDAKDRYTATVRRIDGAPGQLESDN